MNRDLIIPYIGLVVKLVFSGNFVLTGRILQVYDDCIEFRTSQKTSLVRFERILELTPMEDRA